MNCGSENFIVKKWHNKESKRDGEVRVISQSYQSSLEGKGTTEVCFDNSNCYKRAMTGGFLYGSKGK